MEKNKNISHSLFPQSVNEEKLPEGLNGQLHKNVRVLEQVHVTKLRNAGIYSDSISFLLFL